MLRLDTDAHGTRSDCREWLWERQATGSYLYAFQQNFYFTGQPEAEHHGLYLLHCARVEAHFRDIYNHREIIGQDALG